MVIITPRSHPRVKIIAIARSGVVPHHPPNISFPIGLASHGITRNCVSGPMRNAVRGEAIFSIDCPNQNTLHWRSSGTTFCMMVCSADSAIGESIIKPKNPIATSQIEEIVAKREQIIQRMRFTRRRVFTGFFPSPYLPTTIHPTINPTLVRARTIPQISTDTSESPYASISDMNIPPRKLLNIAKNIIPNSPEIPAIIRIVPRRSIFFSSSWRSSRWDSRGNERRDRCAITKRVVIIPIPTAQSIPSRPIMSPENTDTTVKTSPFTAPIFPFALSRSDSGIKRVTRVESAIIRIFPTTIPIVLMSIKSQSHGFHIFVHVDSGKNNSIKKAIT